MSLVEHVKLSSCRSTGPAPPTAGAGPSGPSPKSVISSKNMTEDNRFIFSSSTSAESTDSDAQMEKKIPSAKGKELKKIKKRKIKKKKKKKKMDLNSHRSSTESSSSSSASKSSSASDSSAEEKSKKKKKFNHRRNYFASPKSEMKCLMKKFSKTPAPKKALKDEKDESFTKDLFLIATADARELPPTLEHESLTASGLGLRCDGLSRQLTMQHYTTPSAHLLKRLPGKLIVLVPLKRGIQYDLSEEMVDCDICEESVPITLWSSHIDLCTEKMSRPKKRKTY
ncbi:hypothetical protein GHT06_008625 [Daphnia sinensis]|uniref:Uncharacterized protein n=1 Tax=Daphnia sinensis TaxID=1820382 RepID=A0AAD5Q2F6_9CRUS|nr:hypothetical protein GHT06_008625 [Daphnia sinensis]